MVREERGNGREAFGRIVMGQRHGPAVMAETAGTLKKFQIPFELKYFRHGRPAHLEYARTRSAGLKAIIVVPEGRRTWPESSRRKLSCGDWRPHGYDNAGGRCVVVHGSDAGGVPVACTRSGSRAPLTPPSRRPNHRHL